MNCSKHTTTKGTANNPFFLLLNVTTTTKVPCQQQHRRIRCHHYGSSSSYPSTSLARSSFTPTLSRTTTTTSSNSRSTTLLRNKSSSSSSPSSVLASIASVLPETVRETVKNQLLNNAVRDDSTLWKNNDSSTDQHYYQRNHQNQNQQQQHQYPQHSDLHDINNDNMKHENINATTMSHTQHGSSSYNNNGPDLLNDLYIQESTKYWPHLPLTFDTTATTTTAAAADPFLLAKKELDELSSSIRKDLIGTDHMVLNQAASYFFDDHPNDGSGGKKIRPLMIMLLSRALAETTVSGNNNNNNNNNNPLFPLFCSPTSTQRPDLPQAQRRLAEISELIHTASLFHDDVIDGANTRRGKQSAHHHFNSNKMAILAGDYLLARASIFLARLRNIEVVETMSTIIEHLVRGEVMQLRGTGTTTTITTNHDDQLQYDRIVYYLRKNFYKTGSLMAHSCKSTALLGYYSPELVDISYRYGKHLGLAFQLVDDVLDFEGTEQQLGKPLLGDLHAGLATAPVLFAAKYYPNELNPLILRKFQNDGDIEKTVELVYQVPQQQTTTHNGTSTLLLNGMEQTKQLARVHAEYAMDAIMSITPSPHRDALIQLAYKVVERTK